MRGGLRLSFDNESMEVSAAVTGGASVGASAALSGSISIEPSERRGNQAAIMLRSEARAAVGARVGNSPATSGWIT